MQVRKTERKGKPNIKTVLSCPPPKEPTCDLLMLTLF